MKKVEWLNPNKMKATSGCKSWDRQVTCIGVGNIIGPGFMGRYIRSFTETQAPFGGYRSPGYLQGFDLESFADFFKATGSWVRGEIVIELRSLRLAKEGGILYVFWHINPNKKKTVHGFMLTDRDHNFIKEWVTGKTFKSVGVLQYARPYISTWEPLPIAEQLGLKDSEEWKRLTKETDEILDELKEEDKRTN